MQNPLLDKVLSNGTTSWQIANENRLTELDPNVSVKLLQIVKSVGVFFFIVEYTNTSTSSSLGEYIFAIGNNMNGQAAIIHPPYFLTEPELIYIYTSAGKSENPFLLQKSIKQMSCSTSCLLLTQDGEVYRHQVTNYNHFATGRWNKVDLPTSYTDPDTFGMLTNVQYKMVAVGGSYSHHTYFVLSNYGHVFSFGEYNLGMRGTPSSTSVDTPTMIPSLRNVTHIAAGMSSDSEMGTATAGAVTSSGELWTWGSNQRGQMCVNNSALQNTEFPQNVSTLSQLGVKSIELGYTHSIVILTNGQKYGCGSDGAAQASAYDPGSDRHEPFLITQSEIPVTCSASLDYSACIMTNGKLYTWGSTEKTAHYSESTYDPANIPNNENTTLFQISAKNAVAFTSEGHSIVWGTDNGNSLGALGDQKQVRFPTKLSPGSFVNNGNNITFLKGASSDSCTYFMARPNEYTQNTLEYWGPCNDGLQFGEQYISPYAAPSSLTDFGVVDMSYNIRFALALTSDGQVWGWGKAEFSNMGHSTDVTLNTPTLMYSTTSGDVKLICAGTQTSFILFNNGTLLGVGKNSMGELGMGHTAVVTSFSPINTTKFLVDSSEMIIDVKTGSEVTFLLTNKGNVYGCGNNEAGYVSSNGASFYSEFILINSPFKIKKISVGYYHFLMAISTSGNAYYFSGVMIQFTFPSNDSHVVDLFGYSRSYYFITKRGSVYASGEANDYYHISSQKGLDQIVITTPKLYVSRYDLDGIPYTGFAGEGRATIITRYEYTCNGINSTDENVCSSRGVCSSPDQCECFDGYSGINCETFNCNGIEKSNTSFVCSGRGTCSAPNVCSCNSGSIGTYCEFTTCFGVPQNDTMNVCGGRGMCSALNTCTCNSGYYGETCQFKSCFASLTNNNSLKMPSVSNRFCQRINKYLL